MYLATSKNYDGLPVMKYRTEVRMCSQDDQRQTFNTCYYSHEKRKYTQCSKDPNNQQTYDDRYQDSAMRVSQYNLYNEGGVINKLVQQTNYVRKCPNYVNTMSSNQYPLWTRANIKWSLECEDQYGVNRNLVWRIVKNVDVSTKNIDTMVVAAVFIMILQFAMLPIGWIFTQMSAKVSVIVSSIMIPANLIFFFVFVAGYVGSDSDLGKVVEESNKLTIMNGCSDVYTVLDAGLVFAKVNESAATIKATIAFFVVYLLFAMFQFGCMGFLVYGKMMRESWRPCK